MKKKIVMLSLSFMMTASTVAPVFANMGNGNEGAYSNATYVSSEELELTSLEKNITIIQREMEMRKSVVSMLQTILNSGNYYLIEMFTIQPVGEHLEGPELNPITIESQINVHQRGASMAEYILDNGIYEELEAFAIHSPQNIEGLELIEAKLFISIQDAGIIELYKDVEETNWALEGAYSNATYPVVQEVSFVNPETKLISVERQIEMHQNMVSRLQFILDTGDYDLIETFRIYPDGENLEGPELEPITVEGQIRMHEIAVVRLQYILDTGDYDLIESFALNPAEDRFFPGTKEAKFILSDYDLEIMGYYGESFFRQTVINNNTHFRATPCEGTSLGQVHAGTVVFSTDMFRCQDAFWWDYSAIETGENAGRSGWIRADMLR
jgi:hypothetical protein